MTVSGGVPPESVKQRRRFIGQRLERPRWRQGLIGPVSRVGQRPVDVGGRQLGSRLVHRLGEYTAHATAGLLAAASIGGWLIVGGVLGFPGWWDNVLFIVSSSVTLVMVFAIQHTQARQESAVQRKLDELLRALPHADRRLIAVEQASDAELAALAELNLADRERG